MTPASAHTNAHGQPVGAALPAWTPPPPPPRAAMAGRYCRVEPFEPSRHAEPLYRANSADPGGRNFTYLFSGPFESLADYRAWANRVAPGNDPLFHAIIDLDTGTAAGVAAYMRIDLNNGAIEVGNINYSPPLQQRRAATEAMYLMMRRVFELGYRRYEWKCDSLNAPSRAAAQRLGFSYEGLFRQAVVYKGRSRDTAWYSVIDTEWPALARAYEQWLAPDNFDAAGRQRVKLSGLTAPLLAQRG